MSRVSEREVPIFFRKKEWKKRKDGERDGKEELREGRAAPTYWFTKLQFNYCRQLFCQPNCCDYCTLHLCGMLEAIQRPFAVYFNKYQ